MTVYVTLALCTITVGFLIYRSDMYETEPWYMLGGTAVMGTW